MIKKTKIHYKIFSSRAGYGSGFWTLLAGIIIALIVLIQIETRGSARAVVVEKITTERAPANTKSN